MVIIPSQVSHDNHACKSQVRAKYKILTSLGSTGAVHVVGIVTTVNQAESAVPIVDQAVGTRLQESLALVAVVVQVAGRLVGGRLGVAVLARLLAYEAARATAAVKVIRGKLALLDGWSGDAFSWRRGRWLRRERLI